MLFAMGKVFKCFCFEKKPSLLIQKRKFKNKKQAFLSDVFLQQKTKVAKATKQ